MRAWPLAVLAWGIVVACASAQRTSAPPPVAPPMSRPQSPHDQIEELSNDIETQRNQMGLPEPLVGVTPMTAEARVASVPLSTNPSCQHGTSEKCTDSCRLSDSICTNADKICSLASQLANEAWAAAKCERAKATCDEASKQCCSCQP